ncbi:acetyltransferase (GNAT) family protein [Aminobacter aminovorans]|uniref:Ribosomal N-acetyltransferase YdaF n=1 Tax=Aminobacter aminovorans TaxID=83263 RepID=A0A380WIK7_AMIAI|nr:acetyltransferase (GNAT) family protein [Aminobacter aminovorans]SUU88588.1 Putative ribosomal N-acetyltransferase YdaF [Aminobacter aminovorans]
MGIIRPYRERGLGLQLITAALKQARELGFVRIEFVVPADNARAIALYERVGFLREGASRDAVFVDGRYFDVINMAMIYR